jgi:hypothetical protein
MYNLKHRGYVSLLLMRMYVLWHVVLELDAPSKLELRLMSVSLHNL